MRFATFVLLLLLLASLASAAPQVGLIKLDGIVHPITADYVTESLHQADARNYTAVIIQLNTPGGLDSAMRDMITAILASRTPVIVWVGPNGSRAASAGFLILLSSDVAAMALGTNTGAAHPVFMSGKEMDPIMKAKVENDASAYLRSFVVPRGRNADLAVTGIIDSKSFSAQEALNAKMIDLIAASPEQLLAALDGKTIKRFHGEEDTLHLAGAEIVPMEPSWRQSILMQVIEPNIALVLAAVGLLGIYIEFNHPGLIVPGVAGAMAMILALFAFTILPINLTGALLMVLGISLFVLEAKMMTHGLLAVGGIVSLVFGSVILIDSPIPEMRVRLLTAIAVALPLALITVFLLRLAIQARQAKVVNGAAGLLDEVGTVQEDFAAGTSAAGSASSLGSLYTGQIFVQGEIWLARSSTPLTRGARVTVRAVEGLHLRVEPIANAPVPGTPLGAADSGAVAGPGPAPARA